VIEERGDVRWPHLRAQRWSDEEAAAYHAHGIWTDSGYDQLIARNAARHPDKVALVGDGETLTWQQLDERTRALATGLRDRGVGPGAVVAARIGNSVDHAVIVYGVAAAGAVLFELPPDSTPVQVEQALVRTSAVALFSDAPPTAAEVTALSSPALAARTATELSAVQAAPLSDLPGQDPDAIALLIGTSGTTGTPKIVLRTANCALAMIRDVNSRTGVGADDVVLVAAPLSGGIGYFNGLCTLAETGCTLLVSGSLAVDGLLALVARHRATVIQTVPTILLRLSAAAANARPGTVHTDSLRVVQAGGSYLHPQTAGMIEDRFGCHVISAYGAVDLGTPAMVAAEDDTAAHRQETVGKAYDSPSVFAILDDAGRPLPDGEIGEVVMRGPNTALGYYEDAEATRTLFDDNGWGHFGDLGRVDEDGYLRIVGRLKEIINRGGKKISVNEVEDQVRAMAGLADVVAVGYPDAELGERCAVVVVAEEPDTTILLHNLRAHLTDRGVPKHMWPELVVQLDELPLSPQGKVRRRELKELVEAEALKART
jgi:acyl-CoA synthetase (AMP-forming)/AMP-acid ligase II